MSSLSPVSNSNISFQGPSLPLNNRKRVAEVALSILDRYIPTKRIQTQAGYQLANQPVLPAAQTAEEIQYRNGLTNALFSKENTPFQSLAESLTAPTTEASKWPVLRMHHGSNKVPASFRPPSQPPVEARFDETYIAIATDIENTEDIECDYIDEDEPDIEQGFHCNPVAYSSKRDFYAQIDGLIGRHNESQIYIENLTTKEKSSVYPENISDQEVRPRSVAFTDSGKHLVVGRNNGVIEVFSLTDQIRQIHQITPSKDPYPSAINTVAVFDKYIYAGDDDGRLYKIAPKKNQVIATLKNHREKLDAIQFSPKGKYLATAGADHQVIVLNAQTHESIAKWKLKAMCRALAFHPTQEHYLAIGSGIRHPKIYLVNLITRKKIGSIPLAAGVTHIIWESQRLIASCYDGSYRIFAVNLEQANLWKKLARIETESHRIIQSVIRENKEDRSLIVTGTTFRHIYPLPKEMPREQTESENHPAIRFPNPTIR